MSYSTLCETDNFSIQTCKRNNVTILTRKLDNSYCLLGDDDTNMLVELIDDEKGFETVANSFTFLDPVSEKNIA